VKVRVECLRVNDLIIRWSLVRVQPAPPGFAPPRFPQVARKKREKLTVGLQALEKELRYEWRERE
jgi:hypothetical protein